MVKIAVVEDEDIYIEQEKTFLKRFSEEKKMVFPVEFFQNANVFLNSSKSDYDIIFLDIVLKDSTDGMTLAKKIREKDNRVILIFVTSMTSYAIKGYEVDALGYMVKPIEYYPFSRLLSKALDRLEFDEEVYLTVSNHGEFAKIPSSIITYLEVRNHQVTIHTKKGDYSLRASLDAYEKQLEGKSFVRCNNCYLVNLSYALKIVGNEVLVGNDMLQISRPKRKTFLESLTRYCGEM
ncbi:MAG: LytTR family DNA-binding domain-containing protein [Bacilli bacterium]